LLYWYKSTCFTGTKVQDSFRFHNVTGRSSLLLALLAQLVQKYLLYWYKSTGLVPIPQRHWQVLPFTCFTGIKVQILTQNKDVTGRSSIVLVLLVQKQNTDAEDLDIGSTKKKNSLLLGLTKTAAFYCLFTGIKVQILTQKTLSSLLRDFK
jgi:hypothetical protein